MTDTPKPQQPTATADAELAALMADLDAHFGKKPKGDHKSLNRKFHEQNPQLGKASGKTPERLNPEDSLAWRPVARVTHVVRQFCRTCGDSTEHIGGEFVRFQSVYPISQTATPFGGSILRRTEHCPNVWFFDDSIEDQIEEHVQEVARCPGCIRVEQQAVAITLAADKQLMQPELELATQVWHGNGAAWPFEWEDDSLAKRPEVKRSRSRQLALVAARQDVATATAWPANLSRPATDTLDIDLGDGK